MIMETRPEIWLERDFRSKAKELKDDVRNLTVESRTIIGIIWSCQNPSAEQIAKAIHKSLSYTHEMMDILFNSEDPIVANALNGEFPIEACVKLTWDDSDLKCRTCKQLLAVVPCCRCLIEAGAAYTKQKEPREFEIPIDPKPTTYPPGSVSKIIVMQRRLSRGFSLFAPEDPFLSDDKHSDGRLKERYWI